MPLSHLIVFPLPNGKKNANTARLSVYLSPRLREGGMLSDYTEWRDWGDFVIGPPALNFTVEFDGNPVLPAAVTVVSPAVDRVVWRSLFGHPSVPPANVVTVEAFTFTDREFATFTTMDSAAMSSLVDDLMAALAALGNRAPTRDEVAAALVDSDTIVETAETFMAPIGNGLAPTAPSFEFHKALRYVVNHPYLMRRLGLVFDLEVTLPSGSFSTVAVRTNWANKIGTRARDEVPVRVAVDSSFEAMVDEVTYQKGRWLRLGNARYQVTQVNVLTATGGLESLQRAVEDAPAADTAMAVPAVDEAGISVLHTTVVPKLLANLQRQAAFEKGIDDYIKNDPVDVPAPIALAEDIAAGVRFDVEDAANPVFRSLHQRRAPDGYDFPRSPALVVQPPDDEGWVTPVINTDGKPVVTPTTNAVTYPAEGLDVQKSTATDTTAWRVDDHLMTWTGWSLAAARPGQILGSDGQPQARPPNAANPADPVQMAVTYEVVPGTLPRLRYGHTYVFRGRVVDIAGNSPPRAEVAPSDGESIPLTYGRMNPVSPPTLVRHALRPDPGVGDLVDTIVIKSELTQSNASTPTSDRMFFPPSISQTRLERHGLPPADGIDSADYAFLVARDAETLAAQLLEDPETGELVAGTPPIGPFQPITPGPYNQDATYLPDPMGTGVAFQSAPGQRTAAPILMSFGTWPNLESVTLELRAGSGSPTRQVRNRKVVVSLPKGIQDVVEVSCTLAPSLLPHMKWFAAQDAATRLAIQGDAVNGQNPALSARRSVRLVHAVRLPLLPPSFRTMAGSRSQVGQTTASLNGTMRVHRNTTDRLVLRASWTDPVDDLTEPGPVDVTRRALAADLGLGAATSSTDYTVAGPTFEIGDTRRHFVTLKAESFCRFSSYFTEQEAWPAALGVAHPLSANGVAEASVQVHHVLNGQRFEQGTDFEVDHEGGTVTPTPGGAITAGALVRAFYIPLPVSRRSAEAPNGRTISFTVPASARPDPPIVSHVLPAFSRRVSQTASRISIQHDGRVLRVFLARPWYSSGPGELLGVALDSAGVTDPVLTRWGRDPLNAGTGALAPPPLSAFRKAIARTAAVDSRFDVATHTVVYDAAREIWHGDVQINATAVGYRPFVQLYVCRIQPLAVAGEHVSDPVDTEPLRLGAPRVVTVTRRLGNTVDVQLVGPDRVNVVSVTLQEADPDISDPDLRWSDLAAPVTLTRTGTTTLARHRGTVPTSPTGNPRRLVIEDAEPVQREVGGVLVPSTDVVYREVVDLPLAW